MTPKQRNNLLGQIAVFIAAAATIAVGFLTDVLPFEFAEKINVLFDPASYLSWMWFLNCAGLAAYAIYQVRPEVRDFERLRGLDVPFLISSAANISWLLLRDPQQPQVVADFVVSLVLLGSLIAIYRRLSPERQIASRGRLWAVHYVFSAYLGWAIVASVAHLAVLADYFDFHGFNIPDQTWFTLASVALVGVGALVARRHADVALPLTLAGAFIGLGVEHTLDAIFGGQEFKEEHTSAAIVAWVATAALAVPTVLAVLRNQLVGLVSAPSNGLPVEESC